MKNAELNSLPTIPVSSADNFCKQFGPRSDPTYVGPDQDPNCLALLVFLIEFFENFKILKKL